jgi:hypothetical protein
MITGCGGPLLLVRRLFSCRNPYQELTSGGTVVARYRVIDAAVHNAHLHVVFSGNIEVHDMFRQVHRDFFIGAKS